MILRGNFPCGKVQDQKDITRMSRTIPKKYSTPGLWLPAGTILTVWCFGIKDIHRTDPYTECAEFKTRKYIPMKTSAGAIFEAEDIWLYRYAEYWYVKGQILESIPYFQRLIEWRKRYCAHSETVGMLLSETPFLWWKFTTHQWICWTYSYMYRRKALEWRIPLSARYDNHQNERLPTFPSIQSPTTYIC